MAKAAAGKQTTVTMRNLAAKLSEDHELSKKQTEAVLGGLVDLVAKHLKKGDRIRIGGLGILQVRKRAARMGRNPASRSRSRPAKRWPSAPPRSSRNPSDRKSSGAPARPDVNVARQTGQLASRARTWHRLMCSGRFAQSTFGIASGVSVD